MYKLLTFGQGIHSITPALQENHQEPLLLYGTCGHRMRPEELTVVWASGYPDRATRWADYPSPRGTPESR